MASGGKAGSNSGSRTAKTSAAGKKGPAPKGRVTPTKRVATEAKGKVTPAKGGAPAPAAPFPRPLLGAGLLIGVYAMLPAFFAGGIKFRHGVEIVDHLLPGILVLALVVVAILRHAKPEVYMLGSGVGVLLAGFWMGATHFGLLSQALDNKASKAGALYHCSTAVAVLGLGIVWAYLYRAAGTEADGQAAAARRF